MQLDGGPSDVRPPLHRPVQSHRLAHQPACLPRSPAPASPRRYVGSRCSHGGLEGLCYLSSARTLECGRVTDVHRRPGTAARAAVLARASMAALYASGASVQTLEHIRPCPWGTPLVRGGATGTRVFAKRWLLAGCMAPADAHYEVTAEVHLPQACALPRHHLPGCLFPGALNYDPSAKESAFCRCATSPAPNPHP